MREGGREGVEGGFWVSHQEDKDESKMQGGNTNIKL